MESNLTHCHVDLLEMGTKLGPSIDTIYNLL